MAIMKPSHSKATPHRGIAYILDPEKVEAWGCQNLDTSRGGDSAYLGRQMMETQHLHHKGFDPNERKYYHYKISFHPDDRDENGGPLTPELADKFARKYAADHWPGREVVWAIQGDGKARHIHFIVNAVELETGAKMDVKDAEWRQWKDDCQEMCRQFGLHDMDWRKATKEKRDKERFLEEPVELTKAEQGLKARGQSLWKDELREKIDRAAGICVDLPSFRAALEAEGVTLTRCTEQTISYKLGDHKAVRGDSLGGDYTMEAIRDALEHNRFNPVPGAPVPEGRTYDLDAKVAQIQRQQRAEALGNRVIPGEERQMWREYGRLAGVLRSDIDWACDKAEKATWEEKQEAWANCKEAKQDFWDAYNIQQQYYRNHISDRYKELRRVKEAEWIMNPRNRRAGLISVIYASILLSRHDSSAQIKRDIENCKRAQADLRRHMQSFKADTQAAHETLREKNHPLEIYAGAVQQLQWRAEYLAKQNNLHLSPQEQARLRREAEAAKAKNQSRSRGRSGPSL